MARPRVLLVDDKPNMLKLLSKVLARSTSWRWPATGRGRWS
jgi:CheY-like chemotaxis protein